MMKTYARVAPVNGVDTVVELIPVPKGQTVHQLYHADFVKLLVDVSACDPLPEQWWTRKGKTFSPPAA
jgi:hypothetical protein